MGRRSGLGRGLDALIPSEATAGRTADDVLQELPIEAVRPNRYQPRGAFDDDALTELAASIRVLGVLQPVLVRRVDDESGDLSGDGSYELIAGERRWRAAQQAGLSHVPALVREVEHQQSLEQALVENLHREDLNPVEEAAAFRQLIDDFGLSHDHVAERVGRSRSAVSNTLRLLQLPPDVLELLVSRELGAGHARALLAIASSDDQILLAKRAVEETWSVRRVEDEVREWRTPSEGSESSAERPPTEPSLPPHRPAALLELEELLSNYLDTRVLVQLSGSRNRVMIEFGGIEDLERIYHAIVHGRETEAG